MCGIVGILSYDGHPPVAESVLARMRDVMTHRGPDGCDLWMSPRGNAGLAHRRLSIIDLSDLARQPMTNENGTVWITYNGEIYNHGELRRELVGNGHVFRTSGSDTEVLVHGYEQWGMSGLLERLNGDFAFGLFDMNDGALYLARDHIGVKPLYIAEFGGDFVFASEIKAILEHPRAVRDVDPHAMVHYLSFLTTPAPMTMFKGVYKLPQGSWLRIDGGGGMKMHRYYSAEPGQGIDPSETKGLSENALEQFYIDGIRTRLRAGVERRMMSDVPFGVFLSGGIDSSTNVALMSEFSNQPINTFTVGFKGHADINEMQYADIAAERFRTNHHQVLIDEDDMAGYLEKLVHHQDEPLADWVCIPLYFVSKLARDNGVTVVQVGEGSDEQFGGYDGYLRYLRLGRRFWTPFGAYVPQAVQGMAAATASWAANIHPKLPAYAEVIGRAANKQELFWILSMSFWNSQKDLLLRKGALGSTSHHARMIEAGILDPSYLAPDSHNVVKSFYDEFDGRHPDADVLTRMVYNEFRLRLPELLLMRVDKIGMSVSLEPRVPFLDKELVNFTFDIPEDWKVRNGVTKYLLKKAVSGIIPDELIYRKKMGFNTPMGSWLKGAFGERVRAEIMSSGLMKRGFFNLDYILRMFAHHRSGRVNLSQQIWTIYNLVAWYDYWIDDRRDGRSIADGGGALALH